MNVSLRGQDADHLLAALEWALNRDDLDLGPGLHRRGVEEAARRIEAVADLDRQGIAAPPLVRAPLVRALIDIRQTADDALSDPDGLDHGGGDG